MTDRMTGPRSDLPPITHSKNACSSAADAEQIESSLDPLRSGPVNNIFNIGFEAALGCWVRVFHPLPEADNPTVNLDRLRTTGTTDFCNTRSTAAPLHRHIIHPQAAVSVASVLLETLGELARSFPVHFYPRPPESKSDSASTSATDPRPSSSTLDRKLFFW